MPADPHRDKQGRIGRVPACRKPGMILLLTAALALAFAATSFERCGDLREKNMAERSGDNCPLSGEQAIGSDRKVCLDCHGWRLRREPKQPDIRTHGPVWELSHRGEARGGAIDCPICHLLESVIPDLHTWSDCQSCHPGYDSCVLCHARKSGFAGANPHGAGQSARKKGIKDASGDRTYQE